MVQNQTVQFCKWRLDDNNIAVFRSTSPESGGSAWTRSLCWCSSAGTTTTGRAGSFSGGLTRPATSASPRRRTPASRGNSPSGRRRSSRSRRRRKRWRTGRRTRAWRTNFTQVGSKIISLWSEWVSWRRTSVRSYSIYCEESYANILYLYFFFSTIESAKNIASVECLMTALWDWWRRLRVFIPCHLVSMLTTSPVGTAWNT